MDQRRFFQETSVPAEVRAVSQFIAALGTPFDHLPLELRTPLLLALHELLVNIVLHAYAATPGIIRIRIAVQADVMEVDVEDDAPNGYDASQPLYVPQPGDLPEHGLGMYIIHQAFDAVEYARAGAVNRWHLSKRLNETSSNTDK